MVGIGTTAPAQKLQVSGNIRTDSCVYVDGTAKNSGTNNYNIQFGGPSGEAIGSRRTAGANQFGLDFFTNSTNRMSISNTGNIGIGTTTPAYLLHVKNSGDAIVGIDAGASGAAWNYYLQNGTLKSAIGYSNNNSALTFYTGGADRMVINNNGNVGIGTTTPSYPLQFANSDGDKLVLKYNGNANNVTGIGTLGNKLLISGGDYFDATGGITLGYGSSSNGIASVLTVAPYPGKVGVNNNAPSASLDVNGTFKLVDGTQEKNKADK